MISLICCYNKPKEYQKMEESLRLQDVPYELIGVKNDGNAFSSAASALNYGARKAQGDILVFLHQDILFREPDSLRKMTEPVVAYGAENVVVGLFGAARERKTELNGLKIQDTLDECCVAMSRKTWDKVAFNEQLCDGWHLYVVEFCLRLRRMGGKVLSGDFNIQHLSTGTVDEKYMALFKKLLIEYRQEKRICTTCKSMPTNLMYFYAYYAIWKIKKIILGNYNLAYKIKSFLKGN